METSIKLADENDATKAALPGPKRPYDPPKLVEWGTVISLTRGEAASFEDVDILGTSVV